MGGEANAPAAVLAQNEVEAVPTQVVPPVVAPGPFSVPEESVPVPEEDDVPDVVPAMPGAVMPQVEPPPPPVGLPAVLPDSLGEVQTKVSLRVEDQEMRKALELLGSQASVNIVVSPNVQGTVTVNLEDVTFEQALDVLLKLGSLASRREGDIVYVYTAEELATIQKNGRKLEVRVYHLNYVRSLDFAMMIRPFLSREGTLSLTPTSSQGLGGSTAAGISEVAA